MKTLSLQIRKNGFIYTQFLRKGNKAIYEQSVTTDVKYFEVFIVRIRPVRIFKVRLIPAGEIFPGNEDFVQSTWSFRSYEKVLKKFNSLFA